ncbi:MAG: adenylate/guanylate cyclase domain-containing protein [Hyphomicrobiaceae bacterium]
MYTRLLNKEVQTVLFADMVESVRMMEGAEAAIIAHWLQILSTVRNSILPRAHGELVKSGGDGFLLVFKSTAEAVECALSFQALLRSTNEGLPPGEQIHMRIGIDCGEITVGDIDVYGRCVNRAARLAQTLARPGQIIVSAAARDQLTHGLDADFQDLGDRVLKSIDQPVRAYCAWPAGSQPTLTPLPSLGRLLPVIAVVPFSARLSEPRHDPVGDILADNVIRTLSRSQNVDVISRLSTMAFRGRAASIAEIGAHLKATYVLSGTYSTDGTSIVLDVELSQVRGERVIWSDRFNDKIPGMFSLEQDLVNAIAAGAYSAVATEELRRARTRPLVSLESYTLLLSAIILMHRRASADFEKAREMLQTVIDREPRHPIPKAWLANWYVLRIQQGMSEDILHDRSESERCSNAALDVDPDSSLALTINGLVHTHMTQRHDLAETSYRLATEKNPNEALAWLLKGTHHAFTGQGEDAVKDTQRALRLSPMDPQSYYYHSLSASAFIAAGENDRALSYADSALRSNRLHTSSLRARAVALWRLGQCDAAVKTGAELLQLEPGLTVSGWLRRSPTAPYGFGQDLARTMTELGIPS